MSSTGPTTDLSAAYRQYTPVLLRALGALAKNGFSLPPSEAMDLIHDFFLDGWPLVRANYNPRKGALLNYVYVAFVHYARPRIVKLNRLRSALVDAETLERCEAPAQGAQSGLELQQWMETILRLPGREREFLQQYLHGSRGSERKLADATGLPRYAVRERLVSIIGKLVAGLGRPPSGDYADWRVAEAIWLDDRTVRETAALLGLTSEQVKRARARNVELIVEALRRFESKSGGNVMAGATGGGKAPIAVETLLYQALTNPGSEALLKELRARSSEIVDYLDQHDFVLPGTSQESVSELWMAEVYQAIANGSTSGATLETEQFARELFRASQEDLASIGVAFKETLLPDLPITLVRFEGFGEVPRATDEEHQHLLKQPDVAAAFPNSAELAVYGVTPSMFYFATEAVSGLLDRLIRSKMHGPQFVLKANTPLEVQSEDGTVQLRLEDEVEKVTECTPERSAAMLAWLLRAAEYKPALFSGFEAEFSNNRLSLKRSKEKYGNLYQRWNMAFATS